MSKKTLKCANCNEEFSSFNPNPRFCSLDCRANFDKVKINIDEMILLYESGLTQEEVAIKLHTTQKVIYVRMKEMQYKARPAIKRNQLGSKNNSWKNGRSMHSGGYVYIKTPEHPRVLKCGDYVLEHILVVENYIGRYLI